MNENETPCLHSLDKKLAIVISTLDAQGGDICDLKRVINSFVQSKAELIAEHGIRIKNVEDKQNAMPAIIGLIFTGINVFFGAVLFILGVVRVR